MEIDGMARRFARSRGAYLRSYLGSFKRHVLTPLLFTPLRQVWERMPGHDKDAWSNMINPDLARRVHLPERIARKEAYSLACADSARRTHYHRLVYNAFPFHQEMLNKAAAAFSLEYRHPFFDKRLVEFCLALPAAQKFHQGQTRAIMRRALAPVLPEAVTQRPGKGRVSHHYVRTLLTMGPTPLGEVIQHQVHDLAAYVHMPVMHDLYEHYLRSGQSGVIKVWYTAILALWLHQQRDHSGNARAFIQHVT
jgi:asparagine synthase (glutamine-hydrolysing)